MFEEVLMSEETQYKYLGPWRGSNYRQFFYKDRKIRAEVLYRATVGLEPRTPEEVAEDFDVPIEAVYEAIHYCTHNEDLLRQERERELEEIRKRGWDKPPYAPADFNPDQWGCT
jgi:uncharacterized protein (DUF433 family)